MIVQNLEVVKERIQSSCILADRDFSEIQLIAVSKHFPSSLIREAYEAGQTVFGESTLQEAESKVACLPEKIEWHFIGRVQSNKVKRILLNFKAIHGVDSLRLASYVDEVAANLGMFPKIFLQVNIAEEKSKGGFLIREVLNCMEALLALKRLHIVGLMCIPPFSDDPESSRPWFAKLRMLRGQLEGEFSAVLPSLSMGMSGDYMVAIGEGATHVRVGSAIFGERSYPGGSDPQLK